MNIYLVKRTNSGGYESFDSFVVIAETPLRARFTHPENSWEGDHKVGKWSGKIQGTYDSWVDVDNVSVLFLGIAHDDETERIVCASFNAG